MTNHRYSELIEAARAALKNAYAPYSKFRVGAAVLGGSGRVYAGVNVENASYGLTCCAERSAVYAAVAAGETRITAVALAFDDGRGGTPCGACRQVLNEFGRDLDVVRELPDKTLEVRRLSELLPDSFGPDALA